MAALLAALLLAACSVGGSPSAPKSNPSPHVNLPSPSSSPTVSGSVWVLSTLGLKLHQGPDLTSPAVTVIRPGAQLDVLGQSNSGGQNLLHVRAHDSADLEGWIANDPLLVTTTAMQQFTNPDLGLSLLFPAGWTTGQGAGTVAFQAAGGAPKLSVVQASAADQLPKPPPGHETREEGPVDIYGKTVLLYHYLLDAGGYLIQASFTWAPGRVYQFSWQAGDDNSLLFTQVLSSVAIS